MPNHEREIYHSENGDRWLLCRADDSRIVVLHKANVSSGGKVTSIELGDFLRKGNTGPEHQALTSLMNIGASATDALHQNFDVNKLWTRERAAY